MNNDVDEVYNLVREHLLKCLDLLYKAGFQNSLLYRSIECLYDFIGDLL